MTHFCKTATVNIQVPDIRLKAEESCSILIDYQCLANEVQLNRYKIKLFSKFMSHLTNF